MCQCQFLITQNKPWQEKNIFLDYPVLIICCFLYYTCVTWNSNLSTQMWMLVNIASGIELFSCIWTSGHEKWAVVVDTEQTVAFVFEIESQLLLKYDRLMKPYRDKENEVSSLHLNFIISSTLGPKKYRWYNEFGVDVLEARWKRAWISGSL